jgi:small subunit ribosomal protein S18
MGAPAGPGGFRRDDDRGGYRRDDERGNTGSVKARLRARARKKARRQKKKGGFVRRKVCRFCADSSLVIDYKDVKGLRLFATEIGKVIPRRISGNCAKHQRKLAVAIKRARHIALLPYSGHGQ